LQGFCAAIAANGDGDLRGVFQVAGQIHHVGRRDGFAVDGGDQVVGLQTGPLQQRSLAQGGDAQGRTRLAALGEGHHLNIPGDFLRVNQVFLANGVQLRLVGARRRLVAPNARQAGCRIIGAGSAYRVAIGKLAGIRQRDFLLAAVVAQNHVIRVDGHQFGQAKNRIAHGKAFLLALFVVNKGQPAGRVGAGQGAGQAQFQLRNRRIGGGTGR